MSGNFLAPVMRGPVAVSDLVLGPSPAHVRVTAETWVDESGAQYYPDGVYTGPEGMVSFQLQAPAKGKVKAGFDSLTEAEWAARGIRTAEAWERFRAAESKAKADRAEAARVQAEAQGAAFKVALSDLTEMVTALRQELAQVRDDIAALRRGHERRNEPTVGLCGPVDGGAASPRD
jgi:hypothetical protein